MPAVRPEPQSKYNFADPESRIMPTSQDGFQHCYNAQLVVDADSQLIVAAAVSPQASDQGQLPGLLEAGQDEYGHIPTRVGPVADFRRGLNLHHPEYRGFDCCLV